METLVIATLVNFIVMISILVYFTRKPIKEFLVNRSETIAKEMIEAEKLAAAAQLALKESEANWESSHSRSKTHFNEAEASLSLIRKNALEAARAQAERVKIDSQRVAQGEVARAIDNLEKEMVLKSVEVAGRYLGRNIKEEDRHKLVSEYVEKLVNGKAR